MSGFQFTETMEDAVEIIMTRGWWSEEDKAKFCEAWRQARVENPDLVAVAERLAAEERSGAIVEQTINEVLGDLANNRVSKGAAEQLKGAAEQSIKRQTGGEALGRAIRR
jgi:hypothetical protein